MEPWAAFSAGGRSVSRQIESRRNDSPARSEANPPEALTLAIPAQRDLVAISQVAALFTAWQRERLSSIRGELQKTAAIVILGTRDGTGSEQIAGSQVAAVAGVMRQQLCRGPIQVAKRTAADADRRDALLAHPFRAHSDLELDIDTATRGIRRR